MLNSQNSTDQIQNAAWNYFRLGNSLVKHNRLKDAENAYRKAIGLNPKESYFFLQLAAILHKQGCPRRSHAFYQKAIQLNPEIAIMAKVY